MAEVIESIKHAALAAARESLGESGAGRATAFALEGAKVLVEAVAAGAPVAQVFFLHPLAEAEEAGLGGGAGGRIGDMAGEARGVLPSAGAGV